MAQLTNGVILEGSKGKLIGNYGSEPLLLPLSLNEQIASNPKTEKRMPEGHYVAWVEAWPSEATSWS